MNYYFLFIRGDNMPFAWENTYQAAVKARERICKQLNQPIDSIAICRPKGQKDNLSYVKDYCVTRTVKPIWKFEREPSYPDKIVKLFREKYGIQ